MGGKCLNASEGMVTQPSQGSPDLVNAPDHFIHSKSVSRLSRLKRWAREKWIAKSLKTIFKYVAVEFAFWAGTNDVISCLEDWTGEFAGTLDGVTDFHSLVVLAGIPMELEHMLSRRPPPPGLKNFHVTGLYVSDLDDSAVEEEDVGQVSCRATHSAVSSHSTVSPELCESQLVPLSGPPAIITEQELIDLNKPMGLHDSHLFAGFSDRGSSF
ncbi:hypothetical protein BDM02DRAFT_3130458 [Thelephora ganbajun]|uniref:Uncharacterized protein n=1 Tax=Thelephora ganbajun TaxID=370292 RepID=A0ACB6ZA04_THEGA|nr:hypothetical protein BDM02DRAFT_3130458 [Thelephora ganbajun]